MMRILAAIGLIARYYVLGLQFAGTVLTMMMGFNSVGVAGVAWALLGYSLTFAPGIVRHQHAGWPQQRVDHLADAQCELLQRAVDACSHDSLIDRALGLGCLRLGARFFRW